MSKEEKIMGCEETIFSYIERRVGIGSLYRFEREYLGIFLGAAIFYNKFNNIHTFNLIFLDLKLNKEHIFFLISFRFEEDDFDNMDDCIESIDLRLKLYHGAELLVLLDKDE